MLLEGEGGKVLCARKLGRMRIWMTSLVLLIPTMSLGVLLNWLRRVPDLLGRVADPLPDIFPLNDDNGSHDPVSDQGGPDGA